MTNTALKAQIDSQITNETSPNSISPADVGGNLKSVVDYIDQQVPIKISRQVIASSVSPPDIKSIDFVRLSATEDFLEVTLSGNHIVGKEYYVKNTTAFTITLIGIGENINGNSSLNILPNTYWHLIKEDGSTNSITAFKLSTN